MKAVASRGRGDVNVVEDNRSAGRQEHRYIYSGDPKPAAPVPAMRPNRRPVRRRMSTFNLILMIFAVGVAIVLYVNNILAVNQLAYEASQLQARLDALENANKNLKAELTKKSVHEKIGALAAGELKLHDPAQPQTPLEIDRALQEKLTSAVQSR